MAVKIVVHQARQANEGGWHLFIDTGIDISIWIWHGIPVWDSMGLWAIVGSGIWHWAFGICIAFAFAFAFAFTLALAWLKGD